ncbi:MAG: hypothetical protein O2892_18365 [Actinomycetota bacterium]|nr:hypothetical protein [Actinomycetota bacterium]MDA2950969.1 hypothetical protein [Actinomycetota bacterium]
MTDTDSTRRSVTGTAATAAAAHGLRAAGAAVVTAAGWPVIAGIVFVAVTAALILLASVIMSISRMNADQATFIYQCQSRLGAAVGTTASVQVITRVAAPETSGATPTTSYELRFLQPESTIGPSTAPTSTSTPATTAEAAPPRNPYAALTAAPDADARTAACVNAMKTGEFVAPPLRSPGDESGRAAAELAMRQVGLLATPRDGSTAGPTNQAFSPANLVKYVYYQASRGEVIMPDTLAAQIGVGQRIDPSAISPGDLVYYAFTPDSGPTAVMIAVSRTAGIDTSQHNRPIAVAPIPSGNVIVKRPRMEPR